MWSISIAFVERSPDIEAPSSEKGLDRRCVLALFPNIPDGGVDRHVEQKQTKRIPCRKEAPAGNVVLKAFFKS
jgi:hypothetical protein